MSSEWKFGPHEPIEKLSPSVWRVEAQLKTPPIKRVMTVARRADGKLVVHSAIALDDASMKALDAWGPVGFIVVPNAFHRIDAPRFASRYPDAKVLCPAAARKKVEEVVRVDGTTEQDFPEDPHVSFMAADGVGGQETIMVVKDEDGVTVVITDVVFNMPHVSGFGGFFLKHVARSSGGPRVSNIAKLFIVKDKEAVAAQLRALADTPGLRRLIVGHHEVVSDDPAGALRAAAATLGV